MERDKRNALHAKEMELLRAAYQRQREERKQEWWQDFNAKRAEAVGQMALFEVEYPRMEQQPETD